jgi:hypothetical protein
MAVGGVEIGELFIAISAGKKVPIFSGLSHYGRKIFCRRG